MSLDFELEDREPLRDTPEGELWTSVLVDAIEDLAGSVEWLRSTYGKRRAQLERDSQAGILEPARYRERLRELERERRESEIQIKSCTWFFSHPDSPLEFICDVLAYPVDLIREHARRSLEVPVKVEAPACLEPAPEPELESVAEAEHEPELEPLIEPAVESDVEPAYLPVHVQAA